MKKPAIIHPAHRVGFFTAYPRDAKALLAELK
jgi:hypothetical protein